MIRVVIIIVACISLFWLPWPLSIVLLVLAAVYDPLAATGLGLLADVLYFAHGVYGFPYMTVLGIVIACIALFVRKFAEARIIGG
jgi:hypothetical protein